MMVSVMYCIVCDVFITMYCIMMVMIDVSTPLSNHQLHCAGSGVEWYPSAQ